MQSKSGCELERLKDERTTLCAVFLAEKLRVAQSAIVLQCGEKSRNKLIRVEGLNPDDIRRGLLDSI